MKIAGGCLLLCLLSVFYLNAQDKEYWVLLNEKGLRNDTSFFADSFSQVISQNALSQIENSGAKVLMKSRWLKAVYVSSSKKSINAIKALPVVAKIIDRTDFKISTAVSPPERNKLGDEEILRKQISMMDGERFIKSGLHGKGVKIGVLDVGFAGYRKTKELEHLIRNNRIIEYKDFSETNVDLGFQRAHGTEVLSCLAGKSDSLYIGLATEADYYLATYNKVADLVEALEWFQEKGVKIINNSTKLDFGYYEKEDLDGEHVLASKALEEAAKAGILIFTSMGNEGDTYWKSLVAPSDARGVISVGSISPETGIRSEFSSLGPTSDRRVKPELCGVGEVIVANQVRQMRENGTSFATPLLAGFAACVLQMKPDLKKDQLMDHLFKSASLFPYYDYAHGYGIPQAGYFFRLKNGKDTLSAAEPTVESEKRNDTLFVFAKERPVSKSISGPEYLPQRTSKSVLYNGKVIRREGRFLRKADAEDLNGEDYVYYHIQDPSGKLTKYAVLKMESENIFYMPVNTVKAGSIVRVYYKGYMHEIKI